MKKPHGSRPGPSLELVVATTPLATFVSSAVAAQSLGPNGRGLLSTITVWTQGVALLTFMSLDKGLIAAETSHQSVPPGLSQLRTALRWDVRGLSLLAALIGGTTVGFISGRVWAGLLVAIGAGLTCSSEWGAGIAIASRRWLAFKLWRMCQPFVFAGLVLLVAWAGSDLSDGARTAAMAVGFVLSVAVGATLLLVLNRDRSPPSASADGRGQVWSFATRYHLTTVSTLLATRADLLLATGLLSLGGVGQYAVATAPGVALATIGSAALLRGLTGSDGPGGHPPWTPLVAMAVVVALGVAAMPWVLPLVFGPPFAPAVGPARILLVAGGLGYLTQWQTGRMASIGLPAWASLPQLLTIAAILLTGSLKQDLIGIAAGALAGRLLALLAGAVVLRIANTLGRHERAFSELGKGTEGRYEGGNGL